MSFDIFTSQELGLMDIPCVFNTRQYTFDESFSMLELIGNCLRKLNEDISAINNMSQAISQFEGYVNEQIANFHVDIQQQINEKVTELIDNGTLATLINQTIFGQINTDITKLKTDVINLTQDIFNINYKKGSISFSISPSPTIYNVGETVNGVNLNCTITQGSLPPVRVNFYKNGSLINTKSQNVELTETYLDGAIISSDTEYQIEFFDGLSTVQSEKIKINFVSNMYTFMCAENTPVTGTDITNNNSTTFKVTKGNINQIYSPNNQRVGFAYPQSYGNLADIYDEYGSLIDGFEIQTLNLGSVPYTIVVSKFALTDTNHLIYFAF